MKINHEKKLPTEDVPEGSIFNGYKPFIVQDLELQAHITKYYREDWETPDSRRILAKLPEGICCHYGVKLREYILNLNYGLNVSQHPIIENLDELGINISKGQLNLILTEGHESFHEEKEQLLEEGLKLFPYISVDDTGARHQGKSGHHF